MITKDDIIKYATKDHEYCPLSIEVGLWAAKTTAEAMIKRTEKTEQDCADGTCEFEEQCDIAGIYSLYRTDCLKGQQLKREALK